MSASSSYEFKLGMYISETRLPFKESLELARDMELSYVWCGAYDDGRRVSELPDAQIDEVAKLVDSFGLRLLFLDSGALFKQVHMAELELGRMLEHAQFKEHFDQLTRSMEVASRLGIGAVSSSSFAWPAEYTAGKPTWPMRWLTRGGIIADVDMDKVVKALSLIAEQAERHGVDVALGMMPWNYTNTTGNFRRVAERVGSRRIKVMWGPADNTNCGEWDVATAGFHNVRPYLYGLHLKDLRVNDGLKLDFDYCPIGEGDVDYLTVLRQLRDHGSDVILSLSTHYRPPGGTAEDAMRTNHANLTALIKQVEE